MNGYSWFVIDLERNGKHVAHAERISHSVNLAHMYEHSRINLSSMNVCDTKASAIKCADVWNDGYKKSGIYLDNIYAD